MYFFFCFFSKTEMKNAYCWYRSVRVRLPGANNAIFKLNAIIYRNPVPVRNISVFIPRYNLVILLFHNFFEFMLQAKKKSVFFFVQSKEWFMLNSLAHHNLSINELKCFLLQRYIAYWEYEQRSSEMWHHCNVTVILNFIIDACYTSEAVSFRTNLSNSNNPIRFAMGKFFLTRTTCVNHSIFNLVS